jgi:hypothetical protein
VRIIGGGFEVTNTTAELYKQGTVTVYTAPSDVMDASLSTFIAGINYPRQPLVVSQNFVGTAGEAFVAPGSVQWAAELGAYVPFRLTPGERPFEVVSSAPHLFYKDHDGIEVANRCVGPRDLHTSLGLLNNAAYRSRMETSGAFFSGLSTATTLQVTAVFLLEIQPHQNSVLLPFVTQPAPQPR